jgi:hypothetical protein
MVGRRTKGMSEPRGEVERRKELKEEGGEKKEKGGGKKEKEERRRRRKEGERRGRGGGGWKYKETGNIVQDQIQSVLYTLCSSPTDMTAGVLYTCMRRYYLERTWNMRSSMQTMMTFGVQFEI